MVERATDSPSIDSVRAKNSSDLVSTDTVAPYLPSLDFGMRIEVTPHGPYEVTGSVPLRKKAEVFSEHGEPMTWKNDPPLPTDGTYYLCRCGKSDNKPFCDGSHSFEGFSGRERAPAERPVDDLERLVGTGIDVVKDGALCEHAGFCGNRMTNWFEMLSETEDSIVRSQLIAMIERCPSGALAYEVDGQVIEPSLACEIGAVRDGPLFVSGGVTVVMADGTEMDERNRVTLCRCGASKQKPLCDGTHKEIGFEAP